MQDEGTDFAQRVSDIMSTILYSKCREFQDPYISSGKDSL